MIFPSLFILYFVQMSEQVKLYLLPPIRGDRDVQCVCKYIAWKTIFSFSGRPEKMVFRKTNCAKI